MTPNWSRAEIPDHLQENFFEAKRVELPHLPAGPSSPRTCFVRRMRRDFCNEDTCYQRLVGWGGTIRTSALENQPAKTSVESSSWSFTGLFARSFTGPFDHSFTGVLGSVIHRLFEQSFKAFRLGHLHHGLVLLNES